MRLWASCATIVQSAAFICFDLGSPWSPVVFPSKFAFLITCARSDPPQRSDHALEIWSGEQEHSGHSHLQTDPLRRVRSESDLLLVLKWEHTQSIKVYILSVSPVPIFTCFLYKNVDHKLWKEIILQLCSMETINNGVERTKLNPPWREYTWCNASLSSNVIDTWKVTKTMQDLIMKLISIAMVELIIRA